MRSIVVAVVDPTTNLLQKKPLNLLFINRLAKCCNVVDYKPLKT